MKRRTAAIILAAAVALTGNVFTAWAQDSSQTITSVDQLENATIAVWSGSLCETMSKERLPNAQYDFYNTVADMAVAVETGKADACAITRSFYTAARDNSDNLALLDETYGSFDVVALFSQEDKTEEILSDFNEYLSVHYANGDTTWQQVFLNTQKNMRKMPEYPIKCLMKTWFTL